MEALGIYVRVSAQGDREDERFHSPKEQADRAAALARAKGYDVGPLFDDINVSGAMAPEKRPAMGLLLDAIDRGELAGIAAFSLDRLSREPAHGDALVKRVTKAGGVILTPDIPDALDSPTGEFTFGMLLQVAKLYRSQAKARFSSAKERAILAGIPVGPTPFGYRLRADRVMELDPDEAAVVRRLYELRTQGAGASALGAVLDEHMATTRRQDRKRGKRYTREGVLAMLRNRLYATGRLEYAGVVSEHDSGAIVDEPLWHAAQAVRPARPPRSAEPWLLTGLLTCASCGRNLRPSISRGRYGSYRCGNRACPAKVNVSRRWADHVFTGLTFQRREELEASADAPDLGALEEALAKAEARLSQVLAPEARDAMGPLWAADVKARRLERDQAAAAVGEARQASGVAPHEFRLEDVWDDLSTADRRAALRLYWKELRVGRKTPEGVPVTCVVRGPHAQAEIVWRA